MRLARLLLRELKHTKLQFRKLNFLLMKMKAHCLYAVGFFYVRSKGNRAKLAEIIVTVLSNFLTIVVKVLLKGVYLSLYLLRAVPNL